MIRRFAAVLAIASIAFMVQAPDARAGIVYSTLSQGDFAGGQADGSSTGSIFGATTLTVGDLFLDNGQNGFAGFVSELFGPVTFSPSVGTSLAFSSGVFGSFASSSIMLETSGPTSLTYYVLGTYVGNGPYAPLSGAASFSITFTQDTPGASIGDSGSFSVPPAPLVPEPSSVVMGFTSIIAWGLVYRLRRRRSQGAAA
jgi:hypothetical protein